MDLIQAAPLSSQRSGKHARVLCPAITHRTARVAHQTISILACSLCATTKTPQLTCCICKSIFLVSPLRPHLLPFQSSLSLPPSFMVHNPHIRTQPPLPLLTPDRIIYTIKGVLEHIITVQLIHLLQYPVYGLLRLYGVREDQEFCAGERLETLQPEVFGLEDFDAGGREGTVAGCRGW